MSEMKYTQDHEWIRIEADGIGVVGITDFAQEQLGDIVFVELPEIGREVKMGQEAAVIESVKAAAECNAPVSGTVVEVNTLLSEKPGTVNEDPAGSGWIFKIKVVDASELGSLMDEGTYQSSIAK
jgi:glycine cleavage system H protein